MKFTDVVPGMRVVLNSLPNATVFTVEEVIGFTARLSHPDMVHPYRIDYLMLRVPTQIQLERAAA